MSVFGGSDACANGDEELCAERVREDGIARNPGPALFICVAFFLLPLIAAMILDAYAPATSTVVPYNPKEEQERMLIKAKSTVKLVHVASGAGVKDDDAEVKDPESNAQKPISSQAPEEIEEEERKKPNTTLYWMSVVIFVLAAIMGGVFVVISLQVDAAEPFHSDRVLFCLIVVIFDLFQRGVIRWMRSFFLKDLAVIDVATDFLVSITAPCVSAALSFTVPALVLLPPHEPWVVPKAADLGEYLLRIRGSGEEVFVFMWFVGLTAIAVRLGIVGLRCVLTAEQAARLPSNGVTFASPQHTSLSLRLLFLAALCSPINPLIIPLATLFFLVSYIIEYYLMPMVLDESTSTPFTTSAIFMLPAVLLLMPLVSFLGLGAFFLPFHPFFFYTFLILVGTYILCLIAILYYARVLKRGKK